MNVHALFARHLELGLLKGKDRGRVVCIFHDDRNPSLSVDLGRGLFYCFSCGVGGGVRRFAELVGETGSISHRGACPETPLAIALREDARRQRRLAPWLPFWAAGDHIRHSHQRVAEARRLAAALGDTERGWHLLELAATAERQAWALEAELDALLVGRLT